MSSARRTSRDEDGGWGWFIVTGSFLNHLLFEGIVRSYGLIYMALIDRFHGTAATTAWIQASFNAVAMTTGPISGLIVERTSCRLVVVTGGLLLCVSLVASAYAPNLYFLYFSYSAIGGLAGGFVYSPMIIIVSQYFDKKRGKAMGLAALGGALGTAAMPPIIGYLLQTYGYVGCMLISGGIVLHHCVAGILYRPNTTPVIAAETNVVCAQSLIGSTEYLERSSLHVWSNQEHKLGKDRLFGSTSLLKQPRINLETASYSSLRILSPEAEFFHLKSSSVNDIKRECHHDVQILVNDKIRVDEPDTRPMENSNNNNIASLSTNKQSKHCGTAKSKCASCTRKLFSISSDKLDALRNLSFLLFCFNLFNIPTTIISTFIFLPGLAAEYGLSPSNAAILVSLIGASSAIGRLSFGFVFDLPSVRRHRRLFHSSLGVLLGMATASLAISDAFLGMAVVCVCIGISEGGVMAQRATALSQYVKPHQLTFAFGIMTMFQGFGNLLGPLIQGYLKDVLGTYSVCFYYGGGTTVLSSALLIVDYIIKARSEKNDVKDAEIDEVTNTR